LFDFTFKRQIESPNQNKYIGSFHFEIYDESSTCSLSLCAYLFLYFFACRSTNRR